MAKVNQGDKILTYLLEHGTLDRAQAMDELNIWNLPARVSDLRKRGFNIPQTNYEGKNYGYYSLSSVDAERLEG